MSPSAVIGKMATDPGCSITSRTLLRPDGKRTSSTRRWRSRPSNARRLLIRVSCGDDALIACSLNEKHPPLRGRVFRREAPGGFEPPIRVLQTRALPLGYGAVPMRIPEERPLWHAIPGMLFAVNGPDRKDFQCVCLEQSC